MTVFLEEKKMNNQENLLSLIYHLGNINSDNDIQFQIYETAKE